MNLRRRTIAAIPNLFTLSSVFCGFYSITWSTRGGGETEFLYAALAICLAYFFDTFDGRVARMTKSQSQLGLELDSLADVVSFGVAPAMLVYKWALSGMGSAGILVCGAFVACAAFRLARFNVLTADDSVPKKYIVGLPVPVASAVIVSLVLATRKLGPGGNVQELGIMALVAVLSFFMVSKIRFRSFKGTRLNRQSIAVGILVVTGSLAIAAKLSWSHVLLFLASAYLTLGLAEGLVSVVAVTRKGLHARRLRRQSAALPLAEIADEDAQIAELALAPASVRLSSDDPA
jgi:CDP-diacylglycerol--serine O-phosphatidyltransferase